MAALVINLVSGGTTITLNSSNKKVRQYKPVAPDITQETLQAIVAGSLSRDSEPTITETCTIVLAESSVASLQAAVNAIETMLAVTAPRRARLGSGSQVFVKFTPAGAAAAYRSEILNGKIDVQDDTLRVSRWDVARIEIIIAWTRRFYWEADSETQIPLSNGNGTNDTSGLKIYNYGDSSGSSPNKKDNYVEIAAVDAGGVLPAPLRIALTNTYGTALRRLYVAHKAQGTPASFTHILEAESATLNPTYATDVADATCSGGHKVSVVNVPAAVATLATWTISATQAGYVLSQWIRIMAMFKVLPSNSTIKVRLTLKDSTTGAILAQTDYQTLNNTDYLQPLPTIQLSPNLQGQTTPGAMKLLLEAKDATATGDFTLDFIEPAPVESGSGFRFLKPIDEALVTVPATTGLINDNMIDGAIYIESTQGVYMGFGGPLMMVPATLQRLYFGMDGASDGDIARTATLKAYYRPRKLTV